jgi:hypothetical protein
MRSPLCPPKKKHNGLLAAVIIVLLLVVAEWVLHGLRRFDKRIVLGEKYTYAIDRQKNLKEDLKRFVDAVARSEPRRAGCRGRNAVDIK